MNEETEIWRDVVGYEGLYKVSNLGNVMSLKYKKQRLLKPIKNDKGYLLVSLSICNNKLKKIYIHRLVAQAFIPNPNNYPIINHKDENPLNNRVSNLEWCDAKYNITYGTALARRSKPVLQFDKNGFLLNEYQSMREAERKTGISIWTIYSVCRGKNKSARGFVFRYKKNN